MHNPEEKQQNSIGRKRACLFLSMILLVLNVIATANTFFRNSFHATPGEPAALYLSVRSDPETAKADTPSIIDNTLTLRHKYLLGKQIDINKASMEEFNSLPGVSSAMAAAIIEERKRAGGFRSPNDLMRVKGVKEKRLEKILPFLKKP